MTERPLRIAYLCDHSPLNKNLYSGGNARIYAALQKHVGEVTILSNHWGLAEPLRRLMHHLPISVNLRLRWRLHYALAPLIARSVRAELAKGQYDVLFGAYALQSTSHVQPPYPMVRVFTSDATQTVYRKSEIGAAYKRLPAGAKLLDDWVERREAAALKNQDLMLWPSNWLLETTPAQYGLSVEKMHLVPWGANLDPVPQPRPKFIDPEGPVRLLVIGRNWHSKGGPMAFDTAKQLRAAGQDVCLTVIGCQPPEHHLDDFVTVHTALDKAKPSELAIFNKALEDAHFLILPSYESYGFAFCEASAHGLPSLCIQVGGVPVWNDENGVALPNGSGPEDFAATITEFVKDPARYAALSQSSRTVYEERLNWDAWGAQVATILNEAVNAVKEKDESSGPSASVGEAPSDFGERLVEKPASQEKPTGPGAQRHVA